MQLADEVARGGCLLAEIGLSVTDGELDCPSDAPSNCRSLGLRTGHMPGVTEKSRVGGAAVVQTARSGCWEKDSRRPNRFAVRLSTASANAAAGSQRPSRARPNRRALLGAT